MDENREYFCFDEAGGSVKIAESVIAGIAAEACLETDGIVSLAGAQQMDLTEIFSKKAIKGVKLTPSEDGGCSIEIGAIALYGTPIADAAQNAQAAVKTAVESMSGLTVNEVNINIVGVAYKK